MPSLQYITKHGTAILLGLAVLTVGFFLGSLPGFADRAGEYKLHADALPVSIPAQTKPVNLKEMKMSAVPAEMTITIPEDGWITGFSQKIGGVPESSLRFTWVYDTSQSDPYCTHQQRVVSVMSLEKTADMRFPEGFGYPVKKGTALRIFGGFANFTDTPYEAARLGVDLSFVPASSGRALGEVFPLFLNAECTSLFAVPPKTKNFTKWLDHTFEIPFDGSMVFLGTHSHKFATDMILKLNDYEIWHTSPIHLKDGTNLGNPMYRAPYNGVPVKKGDILDLGVVYSNPNDKPSDAMSSMYIHILPIQGGTSHGH